MLSSKNIQDIQKRFVLPFVFSTSHPNNRWNHKTTYCDTFTIYHCWLALLQRLCGKWRWSITANQHSYSARPENNSVTEKNTARKTRFTDYTFISLVVLLFALRPFLNSSEIQGPHIVNLQILYSYPHPPIHERSHKWKYLVLAKHLVSHLYKKTKATQVMFTTQTLQA